MTLKTDALVFRQDAVHLGVTNHKGVSLIKWISTQSSEHPSIVFITFSFKAWISKAVDASPGVTWLRRVHHHSMLSGAVFFRPSFILG